MGKTNIKMYRGNERYEQITGLTGSEQYEMSSCCESGIEIRSHRPRDKLLTFQKTTYYGISPIEFLDN
jgi:hypothetical protein